VSSEREAVEESKYKLLSVRAEREERTVEVRQAQDKRSREDRTVEVQASIRSC